MLEHCQKKLRMTLINTYQTYIKDQRVFPDDFWGVSFLYHFIIEICDRNEITSVMIEYLSKEGLAEIRSRLESICRRETEAMILEENAVCIRRFICDRFKT